MTAPSTRPSPAVRRAAEVLRVLREGDASIGVSLSHLARTLGCAKSSVANVCAALVESQLAEQDEASGNFRLGRGVLELGGAYLEGSDPVRRFHSDLADLPALRLETVQLAVADGAEVVYLTRHDGDQPMRIWSSPGARLPATTTATGKALLAELDDAEIRELFVQRQLAQPTERSIPTVDALLDDVATTRERGYSIDDEESTDGLLCLGMAVPYTAKGGRRLAVSTTVFKGRDTPELREHLLGDLGELIQRLADAFRLMGAPHSGNGARTGTGAVTDDEAVGAR